MGRSEKNGSKPENNTELNPDNSKMTLEEAFEALDDLIRIMGDEKISLEDSFGNYKKGLELIRYCNESIGNIEGQLEILEAGEDTGDA